MKSTNFRLIFLFFLTLGLALGCSKKDPPPMEDPIEYEQNEYFDDELDDLISEGDGKSKLTQVEQPEERPQIQQGRWVIRYVTSEADTFATRDAGEAAGSVSQGDILVVEVDGDWAVTADGVYVKTEVLSDKAVGRKRQQGQWGSP